VAGPACKVIIDNMLLAVDRSLREVLTSPLVRGPMISAERCDEYLDRMAVLDIAHYTGRKSLLLEGGGGLCQICKELELDGVFTGEIWEILRPPHEVSVADEV
jgi:hypothetical protein